MSFLKVLQNIIFDTRYVINRFLLKIIGVKFGQNLRSQIVLSIESPKTLQIGDNVGIGQGCTFYAGGGIIIGNNVMFSNYVGLISNDHETKDLTIPMKDQGMKNEQIPITIGDDVWLGYGVIIIKNVTIGKGAIIGAGSVVTKDIPEYAIAVGNPARVVKYRSQI